MICFDRSHSVPVTQRATHSTYLHMINFPMLKHLSVQSQMLLEPKGPSYDLSLLWTSEFFPWCQLCNYIEYKSSRLIEAYVQLVKKDVS